jgi:hypothetical protein
MQGRMLKILSFHIRGTKFNIMGHIRLFKPSELKYTMNMEAKRFFKILATTNSTTQLRINNRKHKCDGTSRLNFDWGIWQE